MKPLEFMSFGRFIAFVLPGLVAARAVSYLVPSLQTAFTALQGASSEAAGPIFMVTVAALTVGLTLNTLRRGALDKVLDRVGLPRPRLDYSKLTADREERFRDVVEDVYRTYEFTANMALALLLLFVGRLAWGPAAAGIQSPLSIAVGTLGLAMLVFAWRELRASYVIMSKILGSETAADVNAPATASPAASGGPQPVTSLSQAIRQWGQFIMLVLGFTWGAWTFVFKEFVEPQHLRAALDVDAKLEQIARWKDMVLVRATVHAVNRATVRVYAPIFYYFAEGLCLRRVSEGDSAYAARVGAGFGQTTVARYSWEDPDCSRSIATGRLGSDLTWFEPGEEFGVEQVFLVPTGTFRAVRFVVGDFTARKVDQLAPATWRVDHSGHPWPSLQVKVRVAHSDSVRTEPLSLSGEAYVRWLEAIGGGWGRATSTLSLVSRAPGNADRLVKFFDGTSVGASRPGNRAPKSQEAAPLKSDSMSAPPRRTATHG